MEQQYRNENGNEQLLKAVEIAAILNVSRSFVYRLMSEREIPTVNIGSAKRVRREDLNAFILANLSNNPSY